MLTVFKSTFKDILKSKGSLWLIAFGSLFFLVAYGMELSITSSSGEETNLSQYGKIIFLHVWSYLLYIGIAMNAAGDFREELDYNFIELSLVRLSKIKFFAGKFLAYFFGYTLLMEITVLLGMIASNVSLDTSFNLSFFITALGFSINIALLLLFVLCFILIGNVKGTGLASFILAVLFSLMNSSSVMMTVLRSEKIGEIISKFSPAFFNMQNEFMKYATGFGFSDNLYNILTNILIYLLIFGGIALFLTKNYECKG